MKITFWMKAFIPFHVPGVTKYIPNTNNTESMVIGPAELNTAQRSYTESAMEAVVPFYGVYNSVRRYGYRTDQRGFDASYWAKSRMNCAFNLLIDDSNGLSYARLDNDKSYNRCDTTTAVDVETGKVLKTGQAPNTNMSFSTESAHDHCYTIRMDMAAADPVVIGASTVANINFSGNIWIQPASVARNGKRCFSLSTSILLDNFPAFEAYAAINERAAFKIFQTMPLPGSTVLDLIDLPIPDTSYGAGIYPERSRLEKHTIIDTDGDGAFDTLR